MVSPALTLVCETHLTQLPVSVKQSLVMQMVVALLGAEVGPLEPGPGLEVCVGLLVVVAGGLRMGAEVPPMLVPTSIAAVQL
jgi:hypothetical protein